MVKCTFCGTEIAQGTGKIIVMNDGKIINVCSMKCEKNMFKLKRKVLETRWTQGFRDKKVKKNA